MAKDTTKALIALQNKLLAQLNESDELPFAKGGKVGEFKKAEQWVKNKLPQMGFFSTLDELIANAPFEKGTAEQWKAYLQPGRNFERAGVKFPLKSEELEYSGLDEALKYILDVSKDTQVFKDPLRREIRNRRPGFRLKVGIGSERDETERFPEEYRILKEAGDYPERIQELMTGARKGTDEEIEQLGEFLGNSNYIDISDRVPTTHNLMFPSSEWSYRRLIDPNIPKRGSVGDDQLQRTDADRYEENVTRSSDFAPSRAHFSNSAISHSRTTTHPTSENRLVRLIEEIQSDRHQAAAERISQAEWDLNHPIESGRGVPPPRRGYRTSGEEEELRNLQDSLPMSEQRRIDELKAKIPDAPFKDPVDYATLELRKQLLNALRHDEDFLALVRGRDVSDRFGHTAEQRKGTEYIYDELYPAALRKLARQYDAPVRELEVPGIQRQIDTRPQIMRDFDWELPEQLIDEVASAHVTGEWEGRLHGHRGTPEALISTLTNQLRKEIPDSLDYDTEAKVRRIRKAAKDFFAAQDAAQVLKREPELISAVKDLYDLHRRIRSQQLEGEKAGKFLGMELTPEVKEKLSKAGVPIWMLGGASLLGGDEEEVPGMAKGGEVSLDELTLSDLIAPRREETPISESLRAIGKNTRKLGFGEGKARTRLMVGLLSQLYGIDKGGKATFLGAGHREELPGGGYVEYPHPGLVDEALSLPTLLDLIGLEKAVPEASRKAEERTARLRELIRKSMQVEDPEGFEDNFYESLGTMLGQFPVAARTGAEEGVGMLRTMGKEAGSKPLLSAAEWLMPTVNPRDPSNYLWGALFGGGAGTLGDKAEEE